MHLEGVLLRLADEAHSLSHVFIWRPVHGAMGRRRQVGPKTLSGRHINN